MWKRKKYENEHAKLDALTQRINQANIKLKKWQDTETSPRAANLDGIKVAKAGHARAKT